MIETHHIKKDGKIDFLKRIGVLLLVALVTSFSLNQLLSDRAIEKIENEEYFDLTIKSEEITRAYPQVVIDLLVMLRDIGILKSSSSKKITEAMTERLQSWIQIKPEYRDFYFKMDDADVWYSTLNQKTYRDQEFHYCPHESDDFDEKKYWLSPIQSQSKVASFGARVWQCLGGRFELADSHKTGVFFLILDLNFISQILDRIFATGLGQSMVVEQPSGLTFSSHLHSTAKSKSNPVQRVQDLFPDPLDSLLSREDGQLRTTSGLFTQTQLPLFPPDQLVLPRVAELSVLGKNYYIEFPSWKLMSFVGAGTLHIEVRQLKRQIWGVTLVFVILGIITLWFYQQAVDRQKISDLRWADDREKAVVHSKMASVGELVGGIAHEINNPLMVILNYCDALTVKLKKSQIEDVATYQSMIDKIRETNIRIGQIVKSVKNLSRDTSADPLEDCRLHTLVEDALFIARPKLLEKRVDLKTEEISKDLYVLGRGSEISQVLINLLSNAADEVAQHQEPWAKVSVEEGEQFILVRVTDSGLGIPEEVAAKLFDSFFTTKAVGVGTGLGLSLSQRLARSNRGDLYLESTAPNTTFVLKLKRVVPEAPASSV